MMTDAARSAEPQMGRFSVEVELSNQDDVSQAKHGHIRAVEIRRLNVRGIVDSGATRLVIPAAVATQLGLEVSGNVTVRYADGRTAQRAVARNIRLAYGGREGLFSAVVEPDRESALIGAIVLEELDFLVDCVGQRLVPRDPRQIIAEIE